MEIIFDNIIVKHKNLKESSLKFLSDYFINNIYPVLPKDIQPILIRKRDGLYYVANGRHRLFLSKQCGIKKIPAVLHNYDSCSKNETVKDLNIIIINT